eukprot:scaffold7576_cov61-Phaeocystis_antarctica.AAC.9
MVVLREISAGEHLAHRGLPACDSAHRFGRGGHGAAQIDLDLSPRGRCVAEGEALLGHPHLAW